MRTWHSITVFFAVVILIAVAGLGWFSSTRQVRVPSPEERAVEIPLLRLPGSGQERPDERAVGEVKAEDLKGLALCYGSGKTAVKYREEDLPGAWPFQPVMLKVAAARHREAKDGQTQAEIAQRFAESQVRLYEACVRRWPSHHFDEGSALVHFVSAYFKRGPQQKEELITLLHSEDEELVGWLLQILTGAFEPEPKWHSTPLGGTEIAQHIASVYKTHPDLAWDIVQALPRYRGDAKSAIPTLLRIVLLSEDDMTVFFAKQAIGSIDDNIYSQFDFDHNKFADEQLTAEQRAAIEKYLARQGK